MCPAFLTQYPNAKAILRNFSRPLIFFIDCLRNLYRILKGDPIDDQCKSFWLNYALVTAVTSLISLIEYSILINLTDLRTIPYAFCITFIATLHALIIYLEMEVTSWSEIKRCLSSIIDTNLDNYIIQESLIKAALTILIHTPLHSPSLLLQVQIGLRILALSAFIINMIYFLRSPKGPRGLREYAIETKKLFQELGLG